MEQVRPELLWRRTDEDEGPVWARFQCPEPCPWVLLLDLPAESAGAGLLVCCSSLGPLDGGRAFGLGLPDSVPPPCLGLPQASLVQLEHRVPHRAAACGPLVSLPGVFPQGGPLRLACGEVWPLPFWHSNPEEPHPLTPSSLLGAKGTLPGLVPRAAIRAGHCPLPKICGWLLSPGLPRLWGHFSGKVTVMVPWVVGLAFLDRAGCVLVSVWLAHGLRWT